jgi:N-[(2S)-2-amino-2-carboxyethyl]-L-glutamate dehydrogenase
MKYINEEHIAKGGIDWRNTISVIENAVKCMVVGDFAQPVKPYLRYRDLKNRIIAMPAFVGGNINTAGIKWIASFPDNLNKGLPRAHSVVILNNAETGEPIAIICTALLSVIRTASVSGLVIRDYLKSRNIQKIKIGITGFGPIGQYHLKMCESLLGDRIESFLVYDIRQIQPDLLCMSDRLQIVNSWEEAYLEADIFITCTVSQAPYIDKKPKPGSLHLNVSLRDYQTSVYEWFQDSIIVDDWDEVCRERTDIEMMNLEKGLVKTKTKSIKDIVQHDCLSNYPTDAAILFNPMGMAVFDIALGSFYHGLNS